MDVNTANEFTKVLAKILDVYSYFPDNEEEADFWKQLQVSTPIINNLTVTIKGGKQYVISVKPVSK